jgi:FMN phosphatase YigB (HAD superfamily)
MKRAIIFDLDGTLALIDHRRHFVEGDATLSVDEAEKWRPDWDAFFEACDKDTPNAQVVALYKLLYLIPDIDSRVMIFSGRSESVREKTHDWFSRHRIPLPDRFLMREEGDFTPDEQLKEQWLRKLQAEGYFVQMVFDDRQKVVDMWRRNGITCLQVAPGDF